MYIPCASKECSDIFPSIPNNMEYLLYLFKLGSRKATGKQPANELKHSPSAGLCLQKKSKIATTIL